MNKTTKEPLQEGAKEYLWLGGLARCKINATGFLCKHCAIFFYMNFCFFLL